MHNTNKKYNSGILITCRRRQHDSNNDVSDYIHCNKCRGSYSKKTIATHYNICNKGRTIDAREISIGGRKVGGYIHERSCKLLRETIFPVLNDDNVVSLIQYDLLIILLGNKLSEKYSENYQHDHVRAQLRYLGRIKEALMLKDKQLNELYLVLHPQYYEAFIYAVYKVAGYDDKKGV